MTDTARHQFCAGRCLHCGADDHSLPEPGEQLAAWEKPCPVPFEDRQTVWRFEDSQRSPSNADAL